MKKFGSPAAADADSSPAPPPTSPPPPPANPPPPAKSGVAASLCHHTPNQAARRVASNEQ
ncbi:MAG: hypothetical protein LBI02_07670 [Opitutaceae bacterium]|nr:hypothetical protein [Opitutaceae bacterium]